MFIKLIVITTKNSANSSHTYGLKCLPQDSITVSWSTAATLHSTELCPKCDLGRVFLHCAVYNYSFTTPAPAATLRLEAS